MLDGIRLLVVGDLDKFLFIHRERIAARRHTLGGIKSRLISTSGRAHAAMALILHKQQQ
jgi:hypothetical protein